MARDYTGRTLRELARILTCRFLGMVVILAIVMASVGVATLLAPRWYRSSVNIKAGPDPVADPADSAATLHDKVTLFVIVQRQIILSNHVVATALLRLERAKPLEDPWYPDEAEIQNFVTRNSEYLREVYKRIRVETPGGPETTFTPVFSVSVDWPEEREKAGKIGRNPRELAAERAYLAANLLVDAYQRRQAQLERDRARDRVDFLSEARLSQARTEMDAAWKDRTQFINDQVKGDLNQVIAMLSRGTGLEVGTASLATKFRGEINGIDADLADATTLKKAIDQELSKTDPAAIVVPDAVTTSNSVVTSLQDRILKLRLQINTLAAQFTEEYQELRNARAELVSALGDLRAEMGKQSQRLQQRIDSLTARRQVLSAKVEEDRQKVDSLASMAARYAELQKRVEDAEASYQKVVDQFNSAEAASRLAQRKDSFLVMILDKASMPDPADPRRPIIWLNLVVAAAAGLVLALVYAFLADHFDHTLKSVDDAERYLGTPVLGSVPNLGRNIFLSP